MFSMKFLLYLLIMAGVTYLIRLIPILLVKKQIKNRFLLSFLHYVPYAVLSSMTVPACFMATGHIATGIIGFVAALILAWKNQSLVTVAAGASGAVLIAEIVMMYLI
ncbi:MAG: AzlD domain-containing protein [Clostridia bacterium]|nr:AzlD domain-containing protein [Clostridia bacterium]